MHTRMTRSTRATLPPTSTRSAPLNLADAFPNGPKLILALHIRDNCPKGTEDSRVPIEADPPPKSELHHTASPTLASSFQAYRIHSPVPRVSRTLAHPHYSRETGLHHFGGGDSSRRTSSVRSTSCLTPAGQHRPAERAPVGLVRRKGLRCRSRAQARSRAHSTSSSSSSSSSSVSPPHTSVSLADEQFSYELYDDDEDNDASDSEFTPPDLSRASFSTTDSGGSGPWTPPGRTMALPEENDLYSKSDGDSDSSSDVADPRCDKRGHRQDRARSTWAHLSSLGMPLTPSCTGSSEEAEDSVGPLVWKSTGPGPAIQERLAQQPWVPRTFKDVCAALGPDSKVSVDVRDVSGDVRRVLIGLWEGVEVPVHD